MGLLGKSAQIYSYSTGSGFSGGSEGKNLYTNKLIVNYI